MIGIRQWALLAAFLWLVATSDARRKLKRDEVESLKSLETVDLEEEYDEVKLFFRYLISNILFNKNLY